MNHYINCLKNYTTIKGRASKSEFWYFTLFNVIFIYFPLIISGFIVDFDPKIPTNMFSKILIILSSIYILFMLIPQFTVGVRRLHDSNRSGWRRLIGLIPGVGSIWYTILLCKPSTLGDNKYGPQPITTNTINKNFIVTLIIVLLIPMGIRLFSFFSTSNQDYTGKRVSVDYVGTHTDGSVFDTSIESVAREKGLYTPNRPYTPLMFVVGSGQVVPGFERAVQGMKIGQTRKTTIEPKDAYGEYDEKKITTLPKSLFQEANIVAEVGQTYQMGSQLIKVVSLTDTGVNIDGNHPMAGKTLIFDITLKSVE